jgi:protein-export membrane protein SecD
MWKSRPVQYLGLILLLAAALCVIYLPTGQRPQEQEYTLQLVAPQSFEASAGKGKKAFEVADQLLAAEFKSPEKVPGALDVAPVPTATAAPRPKEFRASISDRSTTQAEAQARAGRIVSALGKKFPGVKLASQEQAFTDLPSQPLFTLGQTAVFPPRQRNGQVVPAVKLGLDLQGGVNLVLQVRRALFSYKVDAATARSLRAPEARDQFASRVRDALARGPRNLLLNEADVNLSAGANDVVEIRTQARDKAEFEAQRKAIAETLKANLQGVTLTEARDPQFFDPSAQAGGEGMATSSEVLDRTVEIVRSRVDSLGVSEPQIQKQEPDRIIVQLPGVNDPKRAVEVVGRTAQLEIRLLPQEIDATPDPSDPNNTLFRDRATGNPISSLAAKERSQPIVSGSDVKPTSRASLDQTGEPAISFELQGAGSTRFGQVTAQNVGRTMPIFLDEKCISAPTIRSAITGGNGQISGGFKNLEEARDLALLLNSGALPAPIDVVENRTVSATLGADSLAKSLRAGMIGIIAVVIFMVAYYRLPGMLANGALLVYCILNLALFVLVGGTLTLPGIAGFLLAIAMSLDTNILVFERLREEMAIQPTFAAALRAAFSRAWTAILDSHVTTLTAAAVLFYLGTGPVKGFALTLGLGVILSLFSAISVTRLFMWSFAGVGERNRSLFGKATPRNTVTTADAR